MAEDELSEDEAVQAALDAEHDNRLFLKTAAPILAARSHESDPSDRVQLALDMAHIAICERIGRICRSDLPNDKG
jgi:hypothetical protein